jgi:hypothetical protein
MTTVVMVIGAILERHRCEDDVGVHGQSCFLQCVNDTEVDFEGITA